MSINYSAPGVPGGEVSPGSGSTGFSSNAVAFTNSSGQLTASTALQWKDHATSGQLVVSSTQSVSTNYASGALVIGAPGRPSLGFSLTGLEARTSNDAAADLNINAVGFGRTVLGGALSVAGATTIGSSNSANKLTLPSTVNLSTQVGGAGGAAALPATPEVYLKVRVPNGAHTLTTLYVPCYLSTA